MYIFKCIRLYYAYNTDSCTCLCWSNELEPILSERVLNSSSNDTIFQIILSLKKVTPEGMMVHIEKLQIHHISFNQCNVAYLLIISVNHIIHAWIKLNIWKLTELHRSKLNANDMEWSMHKSPFPQCILDGVYGLHSGLLNRARRTIQYWENISFCSCPFDILTVNGLRHFYYFTMRIYFYQYHNVRISVNLNTIRCFMIA